MDGAQLRRRSQKNCLIGSALACACRRASPRPVAVAGARIRRCADRRAARPLGPLAPVRTRGPAGPSA
eukprot:6278329-Lingulodinium_polyedra.AAC.1